MTALMKKSTLLAGAFLMLTAGTARASVENVLEANIPFPFMVHGKTFPAGRYIIGRDDTVPSVLLIEGERGKHTSTYVATMPAGRPDPNGKAPALSFTRDENTYRLSTVWESRVDGDRLLGH
jgi:hypothetical protein